MEKCSVRWRRCQVAVDLIRIGDWREKFGRGVSEAMAAQFC